MKVKTAGPAHWTQATPQKFHVIHEIRLEQGMRGGHGNEALLAAPVLCAAADMGDGEERQAQSILAHKSCVGLLPFDASGLFAVR